MRDLADRATVVRLEKEARVRDRESGQMLSQVMGSMQGRAYICSKLESSHVFRTSFSTDPLQMAFNEGERNRGLDLLNDIMRYCPDQYVTMMRERNARDSIADARDSGSSPEPEPAQLDLYADIDASVAAGRTSIISDDDSGAAA